MFTYGKAASRLRRQGSFLSIMRIQQPVTHNSQISAFEARQSDIAHHDPLPDPEPAAPSLPEPDPGVFHHEPGEPTEEAEEEESDQA